MINSVEVSRCSFRIEIINLGKDEGGVTESLEVENGTELLS